MPCTRSTPLLSLMRRLAAIPAAATPAPPHISPASVALIKRFEGCARLRSDALDPHALRRAKSSRLRRCERAVTLAAAYAAVSDLKIELAGKAAQ